MNYTPTFGWYYISLNNRAPSWTGVKFFHNFMTTNSGVGPFAENVGLHNAQIGDVIQLGDGLFNFYHSLLITQISGVPTTNNIYLSSHSFDVLNKRMSDYYYENFRLLHFKGVRTY